MLFTGEHEYTIDSKGRLAIPPDIQRRMNPVEDGETFYLTLGSNRKLRLYPEKGFERLAAQLEKGLVTDESVQEFDQLFFPLSTRLDFDSVGRVRIPERMIERGGLKKGQKVVLIGVRDHLQIRDAAQWEAEIEDRLAKQAEVFERFARRRRNDSNGAAAPESGSGEG
ncbi:MAG: division/cell wall cluster transcriptional repressor MraZ [Phycisphaerales bacterium]